MNTEKDQKTSSEIPFEEATESIFSVEELQSMLSDKQIELNTANEEIIKIKARALKVHEENEMYKAAPELAQQMAQFEFEMKLANRFVASGAFKCKNAEEAYVKIKAGAELGLQPVEAMQALYIVDGSIDFYGEGRSAQILKHGFRIEYLDENEKQVTVRVHNTHMKDVLPDHEIIDVSETAKVTDQIIASKLSGSKFAAAKFSLKNKLRWHAIGMIQSFHLSHLFKSVSNRFDQDYHEQKSLSPGRISKNFEQQQDRDEQDRLQDWIKNADSLEKLLQVKEDAKQFLLMAEWEEAAAKFNTDAKE